jgi:hypothetical protein
LFRCARTTLRRVELNRELTAMQTRVERVLDLTMRSLSASRTLTHMYECQTCRCAVSRRCRRANTRPLDCGRRGRCCARQVRARSSLFVNALTDQLLCAKPVDPPPRSEVQRPIAVGWGDSRVSKSYGFSNSSTRQPSVKLLRSVCLCLDAGYPISRSRPEKQFDFLARIQPTFFETLLAEIRVRTDLFNPRQATDTAAAPRPTSSSGRPSWPRLSWSLCSSNSRVRQHFCGLRLNRALAGTTPPAYTRTGKTNAAGRP